MCLHIILYSRIWWQFCVFVHRCWCHSVPDSADSAGGSGCRVVQWKVLLLQFVARDVVRSFGCTLKTTHFTGKHSVLLMNIRLLTSESFLGTCFSFLPWQGFWDCLILRTLIANTADSLVQCADFRNCLPTQDAPSGPLAIMQGRNFKYGSDPPNARTLHCKENVAVRDFSGLCSAGRLASRLSSTPHHLQQSMTLAFLENQLASALTLQSTQEYRYWLLIYTRFLVNEGEEPLLMKWRWLAHFIASFSACSPGPEYRLRELCKELLGPVHKSATTSWEPTTLVGVNPGNNWSKSTVLFSNWYGTALLGFSTQVKRGLSTFQYHNLVGYYRVHCCISGPSTAFFFFGC